MELTVAVIAACLVALVAVYFNELRRQNKVAKLHQRIVDAGTFGTRTAGRARRQTGSSYSLIASANF